MLRATASASVFLLAFGSAGQERFGITHGNYAGADATYLNPARSAGQWAYADIRFFGADVFAWNSLVAWSEREQRLLGEVRSGLGGQVTGQVVLRDLGGGPVRGFAQADALLPAFSISLGRGTIGAGVRTRAYTSVTGASAALGNFIFHGLGYLPQQGIRYQENNVRALSAAWTEVSLNYAHILRASGFGMFSAGVSAHYNIGHAGMALRLDELDFTIIDSAQARVNEAKAAYGIAMPEANAGSGWGGDLGFTYERTLEEADGYMPHRASGGCDPLRYRYRIGVSLIDLGGIRFRDADAGSINGGSIALTDYADLPIDEAEDLDSLLSTATNWKRRERFAIGTPTALSLQFDQRCGANVYVALAAVQQVSGRNGDRIRRTNSMALTPRFETRYFEASVPVVFHEYDVRRPSFGLMFRFGGFVVGSDHVKPFFDRRAVDTVDLYFRLHWMIHRSPFCKGKRSTKARHRSGSADAMPCTLPND